MIKLVDYISYCHFSGKPKAPKTKRAISVYQWCLLWVFSVMETLFWKRHLMTPKGLTTMHKATICISHLTLYTQSFLTAFSMGCWFYKQNCVNSDELYGIWTFPTLFADSIEPLSKETNVHMRGQQYYFCYDANSIIFLWTSQISYTGPSKPVRSVSWGVIDYRAHNLSSSCRAEL